MSPRAQALVDSLMATARKFMAPAEAGRFEAELARMFKTRPRRDPVAAARAHLLQRHCPAALPPITVDRPTTPLRARKRKRHTWKQLRLPL